MLVKIEARILIFPGTDFHFPSTSVPPGTFLGSVLCRPGIGLLFAYVGVIEEFRLDLIAL